jgi:hypothetical protein
MRGEGRRAGRAGRSAEVSGWLVRGAAGLSLALVSACGGPAEPAVTPSTGGQGPSRPKGPALDMSAEIGALDEQAVEAKFAKLRPGMLECLDKARARVPFIGGDLRVALRVASDGSVRWAYLKDSTLGDRKTEACVLSKVQSATWPTPIGGREGLAESGFTVDPSSDERPPVAWSPSSLGKATGSMKSAVATCRKAVGTGAVKVTAYVDTDGKVLAVGVSGLDEKVEGAADCIVGAVMNLSFPSPGSYAAKVSVTYE